MSIDNLRLFIQGRLRAYDPHVDLDTGSSASVQVVEPIVRRFTPDPLEPDLRKFALIRLRQEFPQLYAKEGSALADALVKPMQVLLEPYRRELRSVKRNQSLIDPEVLSPDEADALLYNVFVRRSVGEFARLKARIYFTNPMSVTVGSTNFAYTASGLRYIPTEAQTISAEAMMFNTEGDLYYFDVSYVSEAPGDRYRIGVGEIIGVTGITAATRAVNVTRAKYGKDEETTIEMITRGENSIGERSLTTVPGAVAMLFEEFQDLQILQVIGFNDPEMFRDVITGGNLGPVLYYGFNGLPGGSRNYSPSYFAGINEFGTWWGSTKVDSSPVGFVLNGNSYISIINKAGDILTGSAGLSVRCIKD